VITISNFRTLVLQSLNQRPGQPMNMPGMQNNPMLTQMNQMGQGNIPPQMNQMVPGQMGQLSAGQMQQNMQVYFIYLLLNKLYKKTI